MVVINDVEYLCEEEKRLQEDRARKRYWKKWGPYVAERQWATGVLSYPPEELKNVDDAIAVVAPERSEADNSFSID
jgi:hypothetical protein